MIPGLIDHLWQSTLFAGAAWLLVLALRKNRAEVRYWIWFAASVKFLIPCSVLVEMGSLAPRRAAAPPARITWVLEAEQIGSPVTTLPRIAARVAGRPGQSYFAVATFTVWACGFLAVVMCWLRRWRRVLKLRRSALPVDLAGIAIPVMSTPSAGPRPGVIEPGVFGIFRPVLLLPEGILEHLSAEQLEAILAHELCHVRRRDNLTAAIHLVVQAAFWFHPPVWWLGARLTDERERACDEEVLRLGNTPRVYAEGILNVCRLYVGSPLACVSGVTGSNLKTRIETIMKSRVAMKLNLAKKLTLSVAAVTAVALPIAIGILHAPAARGQTAPTAAPKFEVASIRRCDNPSKQLPSLAPSPGRLTLGCTPVANLIVQAYTPRDPNGRRISPPLSVVVEGGPGWLSSELYEINAKAENAASQPAMRGPMMQALLEDRFKLKLHPETREIPAWALTLAKGDAKLRQFEERGCTTRDLTRPFDPPPPPAPGQTPPCRGLSMAGNAAKQSFTMIAEGASLDMLSGLYPLALDRPVVNKTGITGVFSFHLEFVADEMTTRMPAIPDGAATVTPSDSTGPSIVTALQEQLGLKLEKSTGPGEFLVIDHVERPTGN